MISYLACWILRRFTHYFEQYYIATLKFKKIFSKQVGFLVNIGGANSLIGKNCELVSSKHRNE